LHLDFEARPDLLLVKNVDRKWHALTVFVTNASVTFLFPRFLIDVEFDFGITSHNILANLSTLLEKLVNFFCLDIQGQVLNVDE